MKKITLFILFIFSFFIVHAQEENKSDCGTEINTSNLTRLQNLNQQWLNRNKTNDASYKSSNGTTHYVPVQLHIIRQDAGTGGITSVATDEAFKRLNDYYIGANIQFYKCSAINYIDDTTYFDYNKTQVTALHNANKVNNVLNIYIANTVSNSSGGSICGHAYFPGGIDFVMQSKDCMQNGSTLAHEVGHYLGLYHTHESQFGNEAVNGSDCASQGDLMCDTPADPTLSKSSNVERAGCTYYGTATDENGSAYTPSVVNVMSYTAKECRYHFTDQQKAKLLWVLDNQRAYLTCAAPALKANFYKTEETSCATAKQFSFFNASLGNITSYAWDFGDGIGTSTLQSPNYTYSTNGIYTVTLTVGDGTTTQTATKIVSVGAVTVPYTNDFEAGSASLNAFVINQSMKNIVKHHVAAAKDGTFGLLFHGEETSSSSPFFQTPTKPNSFKPLWNPYFKAEAKLCVDATNVTDLELSFDKKQIRTSNDAYTNFRITVNGTMIGSVYRVNSAGSDDSNFTHVTVDLSAYDGQLITIGFEGTHKYHKNRNSVNAGTASFIDNIAITGNVTVLSTVDHDVNEIINLYPNPTKNYVTLEMNTDEFKNITVFNVLGQNLTNQVRINLINSTKITVDLSNLQTGIYYIKSKSKTNMVTKQ